MQKAVWLTYDLGVKGDYQHLYAWLDDQKAIECGNNLAYFKYPIDKDDDDLLKDKLREDLEKNVSFQPGDRIYIIRKNTQEKFVAGSFIIGKRKATPWEGYGKSIDNDVEEGQ